MYHYGQIEMNTILNLQIIFSMLFSLNECNYTKEFHIMLLPSSSVYTYSLYHHYENSRYLFLTNHNSLFTDTLYHQYQINYPSFHGEQNTTSQYCVIDTMWEELYFYHEEDSDKILKDKFYD